VTTRPAAHPFDVAIAATAVMGSQIAALRPTFRYHGMIGYWYGKAPGLERAADAIRHAQYAGTSPRGGVVAFVGDDPSCKFPGLPPGDGPCRARVRGMLWLPTWGSQRPRVNAA